MNTVEAEPERPVLTCDLGALTAPDLAVVDALARLRLAAARHGVAVVLLNAGGPLRELLAFSGLSALLPGAADPPAFAELLGDGVHGGLGLQSGREAEEREEHVGVQEVGEAGDPPL
ncbi:STAS domain-containing protein [Kitasatospora sp. NPDC127116]|uniref:STAS domain-containing protein n=1 Tax=unclassified Kitasatospora TaxID=2633591 RepID=UPI003631CE65